MSYKENVIKSITRSYAFNKKIYAGPIGWLGLLFCFGIGVPCLFCVGEIGVYGFFSVKLFGLVAFLSGFVVIYVFVLSIKRNKRGKPDERIRKYEQAVAYLGYPDDIYDQLEKTEPILTANMFDLRIVNGIVAIYDPTDTSGDNMIFRASDIVSFTIKNGDTFILEAMYGEEKVRIKKNVSDTNVINRARNELIMNGARISNS